MTQAKKNVWIIDISVKEPITVQDSLDELQRHLNQHGKSKVKISLFRSKIYYRTDIEDIWSIFYQVRPVVSHLEVSLLAKTFTPNNIGEAIKGP